MLQDRTANERIGISVIIPVYNKQKYLNKCIESVLNSSFSDVEIICVDDYSTDGSRDVLKKIAQKNKQIILIENDENKGVSYSRNVGINAANGKYIAFLDSDDYLDKQALENYYEKLEETNADGCFIKIISNNGNVNISNAYNDVYSGRELLGKFVENDEMFLYACGSIWSTDFIRKNNIYFKEFKIGEGGLFTLELMMHAKSVVVSDYPGYNYYINESSTVNKNESMKLSAVGQLKQLIFMILQLNLDSNDKEIVAFLRWYLKKNMGGINNLKGDELDGNYFIASNERFLAELIKGKFLEKEIILSKEDEEVVNSKGCVYVYGAGYETLDVIKFCNRSNLEIKGIYVSDEKANPQSIYGFRVKKFCVKEIDDLSIPFLISAHKKHQKEIKDVLINAGIKNIVIVSD